MTIETSISTTLNLLAAVGVGTWNVCVVEDFPEHPMRAGLCSYRQKTIYLSSQYLDDDEEMLKTIRHEIAHVLSEGDEHGELFEDVLATVPSRVVKKRDFRIEIG